MAVKIEKSNEENKRVGGADSGAGPAAGKGVSFIASQAKKELKELTNLEPSTIMGATREGDEWMVTMEMIEKKSIPDAMDILGIYEVRLNDKGQILNFTRISLRKRGDTAT